MKISNQEILMYEVMNAIFESGIPIDFKGSMVLRVCLEEAGYHAEIRHTEDIDANWISEEQPSEEMILSFLQNALDEHSLNLKVKMTRMYGLGKSAGITFCEPESGCAVFSMDMDINRLQAGTSIYLKFPGINSNYIKEGCLSM